MAQRLTKKELKVKLNDIAHANFDFEKAFERWRLSRNNSYEHATRVLNTNKPIEDQVSTQAVWASIHNFKGLLRRAGIREVDIDVE